MKVLEQTVISLELADLNKLYNHPYPVHARSSGLHVSEVIRAIAVKNGLLTNEDREDEEVPLRMLVGMGWERVCVGLYPMYTSLPDRCPPESIWWQPDPLVCDGLHLSPDGYSNPYTAHPTVEEFKYTAKSLRVKGGEAGQYRDITHEWMWMTQVMAYCYAATRTFKVPVHRARLHVCWARGDYSYPQKEVYVRYLVEFSEKELRANWAGLLSARDEVAHEQ